MLRNNKRKKVIWHLYLRILLFASFISTWKYSVLCLVSLCSPQNQGLSRTFPSKQTSLMARSWTLQYMSMFAWREWILLRETVCIPKCGGWSTEATDQRITFWSPKQAFKRYCRSSAFIVCHSVPNIGIAKLRLILPFRNFNFDIEFSIKAFQVAQWSRVHLPGDMGLIPGSGRSPGEENDGVFS